MNNEEKILEKFFNMLEEYIGDSKNTRTKHENIINQNKKVINTINDYFNRKSNRYRRVTNNIENITSKYIKILDPDDINKFCSILRFKNDNGVTEKDIDVLDNMLTAIKNKLTYINTMNIERIEILKEYYNYSIKLINLYKENKIFTKEYVSDLLPTISSFYNILSEAEEDIISQYLEIKYEEYLIEEERKKQELEQRKIKELEERKRLQLELLKLEDEKIEKLEKQLLIQNEIKIDIFSIIDKKELELLSLINNYFYDKLVNLKYINSYENYKFYNEQLSNIDVNQEISNSSELKEEVEIYRASLIIKEIYRIIEEIESKSLEEKDIEVLAKYLEDKLIEVNNIYNEFNSREINCSIENKKRILFYNPQLDNDYKNTKFYKFLKSMPREFIPSFKHLIQELQNNDIDLNNSIKYKKVHCGSQKGLYEIRAIGIRILFTILPNKDIYIVTGFLKKNFNKFINNNYLELLSKNTYQAYNEISNKIDDEEFCNLQIKIYDEIINHMQNENKNKKYC